MCVCGGGGGRSLAHSLPAGATEEAAAAVATGAESTTLVDSDAEVFANLEWNGGPGIGTGGGTLSVASSSADASISVGTNAHVNLRAAAHPHSSRQPPAHETETNQPTSRPKSTTHARFRRLILLPLLFCSVVPGACDSRRGSLSSRMGSWCVDIKD